MTHMPRLSNMIKRPARLREAHCHLPMLGRALSLIDVSMCRSLDELLHMLRDQVDADRPRTTDSSSTLSDPRSSSCGSEWIIATGMRIESWSVPRWPTRTDLDRVIANQPCVVRSFDFHSLVANTAALAAAKVTRHTPNPPSGVLQRDSAGELTGIALESAEQLIWNAIPEPTEIQRRQHVRAALQHLQQLGFTEAHDLKSPAWLGHELAQMADHGQLQLKIELFPMVDDATATMRDVTQWERDQVRLGGFKLFADGTLNSRTAWMLHPYADGMAEHPRGLPNWRPEQITEAVRTATRCGKALATHAIGDAAVRAVLDAIETVQGEENSSTKRSHQGIRHRIEHCEVVDERDVPRFAQLGVIASVQPCHLLYDIPVLRRAIPDRLDRVLPLAELIQAGCTPGESLWFGSDAPIVPADPIASIAAAVGRGSLDVRGETAEIEPIGPGQAISEDAAWTCFAGR